MKNTIPRLIAIHDMAGFGRCSLTTIIPVLSSMKVQVCPIPTAILSTHGAFDNLDINDCTDHMWSYSNHWKELNLKFDCIYTGFIASERQIDIIDKIIDDFSEKTTYKVVDPVMGDDGKIYSMYNDQMVEGMKKLCKKADLITPNMTEVYLLIGEEYSEEELTNEKIEFIFEKLSKFSTKEIVITGVKTVEYGSANIGYSRENNEIVIVPFDIIPVSYPGTGDLFTSVLIGNVLSGNDLRKSIEEASKFVSKAVALTYQDGTNPREGVCFEKILSDLHL